MLEKEATASLDPPEYRERLVAFIDILGFEHLVGRFSDDEKLHSRVYNALARIKSLESTNRSPKIDRHPLEVSVFSDSVVISCNKADLHSLVWTCGYLQADLLFLGILVRGGISVGKLLHEHGILYGEGLIRAYRLETKTAFYPRIVMDPSVSTTVSIDYAIKFLRFEDDGLTSIDPFKFDALCPGAAEMASEGYSPRREYLNRVGGHLTEGLSSAAKPDQKVKWSWLICQYNVEVMRYNRTASDPLSFIDDVCVPRVATNQ